MSDSPRIWGDADATTAVVALHGRGQDSDFVRGLSNRIGAPGVRYYTPGAPGRSWYPHPFLERSEENAAGLARALDTVTATIGLARADGLERIALLGFSQGACVAAHYLLTDPGAVDAGVLFTGGYVGPHPLDPAGLVDRIGIPVLLRSISQDPWVPTARVADTARLLVTAGAHVDAAIEPGEEHIITERAVSEARKFLGALTGR